MKAAGDGVPTILAVLSILLMAPVIHTLEPASVNAVGARATSTWSGNVWLNSSYHVSSSDTLIISDCTQVWMAQGVRIFVDGRLTVQGTETCQVNLHSQGAGDHRGIQFNSSSRNRGSIIDNLSIEDSEYGITIYNSNPSLNSVHVENADYVAIDLYNAASPTIKNLSIQDGGQDIAAVTTWRQGIGLSVGNYSTPVLDGMVADGLENRALNIWGNSGGLYRNLSLTDIGGSVLSLSAAIWIEDSQVLIEDTYIDECDNGAYVRHITDSSVTRAVIRRMTIEDSQFRGLMIDRENYQDWEAGVNYQTAIIEGLVVRGTGGPGAADQDWAQAAVEINGSGAWIEDAVIEDNIAPGIRLFRTDSTTTIKDTTVRNSGNPDKGAHIAGIHNRAGFFAPYFHNVSVEDSPGPGIWLEKGGTMQGTNWTLQNNTEQGIWIDRASMAVDGIELISNGLSGMRIFDSRKVEMTNMSSLGNGHASTGTTDGAGLVIIESNVVEVNTGDISCTNCISRFDAWGGVYARDSVDLWLTNFSIHDPGNATPAVDLDNGGLTVPPDQESRFHFNSLITNVNRSGPAIVINEAAGVFDGLDMLGSHGGLTWNADYHSSQTNELSNAILRGSGCLVLENHSNLMGHGVNISNDCTGRLTLKNVVGNWSDTYDESGNHILDLDASSNLRLHRPNNIDMSSAQIENGAQIDLAWDMTIWVMNQRGNGVPRADIEVSFDQYSTDFDYVSDWLGFDIFQNFVGQRWNATGSSAFTTVDVDCTYDNTTNTTTITLDEDKVLYCILDLANQPPFIVWESPSDQDVFPSGGQVIFNATGSWDLDDDPLEYEWTSSIDGRFDLACFQSSGSGGNGSFLIVNDPQSSSSGCLSDGIHDITLEVCDSYHCIEETRIIELTNLPPTVVVDISPSPDVNKVAHLAWNGEATFNTTSTIDPEGDELTRRTWASHWTSSQYCTGDDCAQEWNQTFSNATSSTFVFEIGFSDGINPEVVWSINIELFNELPIPSLEVSRDGDSSENLVTLDARGTVDPEGDAIGLRWISDIDGLLFESDLNNSLMLWTGHLSRGDHRITLQAWDDSPEHTGQVAEEFVDVEVVNSVPVVYIESPADGISVDSSTLLEFSSLGSGDWDSWCDTYPTGIWYCSNEDNPQGSDWLSVDWTSNLSGSLTPSNQDWLIWEGRLEAGSHEITLTMDDLLGGVNSTSIRIDVSESAPVLGLVTPEDGEGFLSRDTIWVDASTSTDYDGDVFQMTLVSDHPMLADPLLENVDPMVTHALSLPSGTHVLTFTLTDSNGMVRNESITIVVADSDPVAIVDSPEVEDGINKRISPSELIILSGNSSFDADGDISSHEWFEKVDDEWVSILDARWGEVSLSPGNHHLKLVVTDTRRASNEYHFNLTLSESWPSLSNLKVSEDTFTAGVKASINVSVTLTDEDGTTELVEASIVHGIQRWTFQLNDDDEDGIWNGVLEFTPEDSGRPQLKVVAIDYSGDDQVTSTVSLDMVVNEAISDTNWAYVGGGIGGGGFLILLLVLLASRRRRRLSEMDLVESWSSFDTAVRDTATSDLDQAALLEEHSSDTPEMIDL